MKSQVQFAVALVVSLAFVGCADKTQLQKPTQNQRQSVEQQRADEEQGAPAKKVEAEEPNWPEKARFAVCSLEGSTVAFMDGREIVVMRNEKEYARIKSINMLDPSLSLSPDGKFLAAYAIWKREVVVINLESMEEKGFKFSEVSSKFEFNPDGKLHLEEMFPGGKDVTVDVGAKAVGSTAICSDNGATVLMTENGQSNVWIKGRFVRHFNAMDGMKLSKDGETMATCDGKKLLLIDVKSSRELQSISATQNTLYEFSPISSLLAVAEKGSQQAHVYGARGSFSPTELRVSQYWKDESIQVVYWYNYGAEYNDCLCLVADQDHVTQWVLKDSYWSQGPYTVASLDQGYEFEADGSLNENATDYVANSR